MKTKTLLIYFLILLALLTFGLAAGFTFFNHEKENALQKALALQQRNSMELITDQVYGDLLVDNTMEVERKLSVMVGKKTIENFAIIKGEDAQNKVSDNLCQTIYFDKTNQLGKWGLFCVKFSSEHLGSNLLNLKGVTIVVISLAVFLVLIIFGIFRKISQLNSHLHKGVELALKSPELKNSSSELWAPVLGQLREEVKRKQVAEKELLNKQIEEEKIQLAHQVSHDIRSPLSVLKMALADVGTIAIEQRLMIENALTRINDISSNLLVNFKERSKIVLEEHPIKSVVEMIVAEKKYQYKDHSEMQILFEASNDVEDANVKINKADFHRIISNIINNSVEALKEKGSIEIKITLHHPMVVVSITDNGAGIPKDVLLKLGERGVSFGKSESSLSGSGLGLAHAKETMKSYGGQLLIDSEVHVGTTVTLSLPLVEGIKAESFPENFDYVLIDNDKIMRLAWEQKAKKGGIKLLTLSSIGEFEHYVQKIHKNSTRIYLDSDLGESSLRGEEFALILHAQGYQHIFMASSFTMPQTHSWLKNSGKSAPF